MQIFFGTVGHLKSECFSNGIVEEGNYLLFLSIKRGRAEPSSVVTSLKTPEHYWRICRGVPCLGIHYQDCAVEQGKSVMVSATQQNNWSSFFFYFVARCHPYPLAHAVGSKYHWGIRPHHDELSTVRCFPSFTILIGSLTTVQFYNLVKSFQVCWSRLPQHGLILTDGNLS